MSVVASDLEGTLSSGATWKGVARYLRAYGYASRYRGFLLKRVPGIALVRLGLINLDAFSQRWLVDLLQLLEGFTSEQLQAMGEWVVEHEVWIYRRVAVLAELENYRSQGHRLVLASGTYQPVLDAFARRIGAEAIGSSLEMADGRATGKMAGAMNVKEVKAERLRGALRGGTLVAAYGDSSSDIPMLAMSRSPVAVCPDAEFKRTAQECGWRILEDGCG